MVHKPKTHRTCLQKASFSFSFNKDPSKQSLTISFPDFASWRGAESFVYNLTQIDRTKQALEKGPKILDHDHVIPYHYRDDNGFVVMGAQHIETVVNWARKHDGISQQKLVRAYVPGAEHPWVDKVKTPHQKGSLKRARPESAQAARPSEPVSQFTTWAKPVGEVPAQGELLKVSPTDYLNGFDYELYKGGRGKSR